jgi:hypothetical protein
MPEPVAGKYIPDGTTNRVVSWPADKPIPQDVAKRWFQMSAPTRNQERGRERDEPDSDGPVFDDEVRGTSGVVRLGAFILQRTYADGTGITSFVAIKALQVGTVERASEAVNEYNVHRAVYDKLPPEAKGYFTEPLTMEALPCTQLEQTTLVRNATTGVPPVLALQDSSDDEESDDDDSADDARTPDPSPPNKLYRCNANDGGEWIYLVQTWACGRTDQLLTLKEFLKFRRDDPDPLTLKLQSLIKIGNDIGKALKYCHRTGHTHNDLYSRNVVVCEAPRGSARFRYNAKLIDFGKAEPITWDKYLDMRIEEDGRKTPVAEMLLVDSVRLIREWELYAPASASAATLAAAIAVGYALGDGDKPSDKPLSPLVELV